MRPQTAQGAAANAVPCALPFLAGAKKAFSVGVVLLVLLVVVGLVGLNPYFYILLKKKKK